MKTKHTGGPAFPVPNDANVNDQEGMTLRDYFAIRAFQSRLEKYKDWTLTQLTEQAYLDADSMLEARK